MKTRIIIDSTTDLMPSEASRVTTVPLTVRFGDKEYVDGTELTRQEFYKMLKESETLPQTSQATPDAFMKEFEKVKEAGDEAVVITLSSKLSGTYQSANIAADGYEGIYIVDSETASIGCAVLCERALRLLDEGKRASEIADILNEEKKKIVTVALLDTLENLKKGGRISKSASVAGALLNIKPVLSIENGEIMLLGKARGLKMGNNLLRKEIEKAGGVDFSYPVLLGYTGESDDLLKNYIDDSCDLWENNTEMRYTLLSGVIGTHTGAGTICVSFFKK